MKRLLIILLVLMTLCPAGLVEAAALDLPQLDDSFTQRDLEGIWDATATLIALEGDTAVTASHVVSVEGGTITILDGGVYMLTGTLDDGQIVVDVKDDEKVQLVLNGASITSSSSATILVRQADKVFITLAKGTENHLTSTTFEDEAVDAVIWSDEDLTFNGTGSLTIYAPTGSGIDGNDDIKFASGTYVITASARGVDANDSIRIAGGDFTVTSGETAFRADHDTNGELGYIYIWDGTFTVTTGDGAGEMAVNTPMGFMGGPNPPEMGNGEMTTPPDFSGEMPSPPDFAEGGQPQDPPGFAEAGVQPEMEAEDTVSARGFKASGDIVVIGGTFDLDTADDAFHADGDLLVFDGEFRIASHDDGIHADGSLTVVGGTVDITQSSEGLEAEVITLAGGSVALVASDDGLNARSSTGEKETFDAQEGVLIEISGGSLRVNAGGDGIDSNGDIIVTGGSIVVSGPENNMNGALDYNGEAVISGGTVVAAGASGMAENFSDTSTQAALLVNLTGDAGEISLSDAEGNTLLSEAVEKSFGTVVISCPGLTVGETYTVTCGDSSVEITLTDTVTGADSGYVEMTGGPNPGAMPQAASAK